MSEPAETSAPASAAPSSAQPGRPALVRAWIMALGVTAATALAIRVAFDPALAGSGALLVVLGGTYAVLVAGTSAWLWRRGDLRQKLAPSRGDITIGALLAVLLYLVATFGHKALTAQGSAREPWIMRFYLQIGDPRIAAAYWVGIAVLLVAAAEEIAWRGWVMQALVDAHGERFGWLASTALYGLAHAPTVVLLSDPAAGPNPLVVLAALGCGLVWGYLAQRIGRLGPSIFAHALFSWAAVEFPIWRM